jgi:hypothetical protein
MEHGAEETLERMRNRRILLVNASMDLNALGPDAEAKAGIYDNRPDMRPPEDDFMMKL